MSSFGSWLPFFAFAVLATYGVSRLLLFMSRRWEGGFIRILDANGLSGAICMIVFGISKGWHPLWVSALVVFGPAQVVVLLIDIWKKFKTGRATEA
jgi:hypothetical protein